MMAGLCVLSKDRFTPAIDLDIRIHIHIERLHPLLEYEEYYYVADSKQTFCECVKCIMSRM
jgi:hypothetical protein